MKKIKVITENCIGCGACVGIDEEHFDFNENGFSIVKSNENLETEELQNAIEACPVAIISIVEEEPCQGKETEKCNCHEKIQHDNQPKCNCHEKCQCDQTSEL